MFRLCIHVVVSLLLLLLANNCFAQKNAVHIRHKIQRVTKKIAEYKFVDGGAIGALAIVTDQFDRFMYLCDKATLPELINLSADRCATVRVYAFWALARRKYEGIKDILDKHEDDTATVFFRGGCMGALPQPVNYILVRILSPSFVDRSYIKLTNAEVAVYNMKIKHSSAL